MIFSTIFKFVRPKRDYTLSRIFRSLNYNDYSKYVFVFKIDRTGFVTRFRPVLY